tara:strand:- start:360 stop:641 length:282 start_codon:yes stop_codon:yes gene_type:complete
MTELSVEERWAIIAALEQKLADEAITLGELVRAIRKQLYGMTQMQYAEFIGISDRTLREIEKGTTDARLSIMNKVLAPGGFQLSARRRKPPKL